MLADASEGAFELRELNCGAVKVVFTPGTRLFVWRILEAVTPGPGDHCVEAGSVLDAWGCWMEVDGGSGNKKEGTELEAGGGPTGTLDGPMKVLLPPMAPVGDAATLSWSLLGMDPPPAEGGIGAMLGSVSIEIEALSVSASTGTVTLPGTSPVVSLFVGDTATLS